MGTPTLVFAHKTPTNPNSSKGTTENVGASQQIR